MQNLKGWRTLAINLLIAVANVVVVFNWSDVVDAKTLVWINGIGIPAINVLLRALTTTPLGKAA